MRLSFLSTFEKVDANFREIFGMLFPGGQAHLEMTDPDHPSERGIEVVAHARGKRITKMMLMSGGERRSRHLPCSLPYTAHARVPLYVLDEVEAALDDSNLSKLLDAIDVLRKSTQLLVVSHQRRTWKTRRRVWRIDAGRRREPRREPALDRTTGKVVERLMGFFDSLSRGLN